MFHFITFHFYQEKQFEGTIFLGATSPKFKANLFNIKEHLRLVL